LTRHKWHFLWEAIENVYGRRDPSLINEAAYGRGASELIEIVYGRSCHVRIVKVQAVRAHNGPVAKAKAKANPPW
jgi:hypothetical protein